jgi:Pyruvate/2-oxoacid:ferredoxin oxidoreductase delta subunit
MHLSSPTNPAPARDKIGLDQINLNYYEPTLRQKVSVLPPERRTDDTEIEGGYGIAAFNDESARCFSCGNCLACDNCWNLCPDNAVIKTAEIAADGSHYVFDYEYCKGCGLCAHECPCGYIVMIPEPD